VSDQKPKINGSIKHVDRQFWIKFCIKFTTFDALLNNAARV